MSFLSRYANRTDRAADKAERLRARGGLRNLQRARRLEEQVARDSEIINSWTSERWG